MLAQEFDVLLLPLAADGATGAGVVLVPVDPAQLHRFSVEQQLLVAHFDAAEADRLLGGVHDLSVVEQFQHRGVQVRGLIAPQPRGGHVLREFRGSGFRTTTTGSLTSATRFPSGS